MSATWRWTVRSLIDAPSGPGIRLDSGVVTGSVIPGSFDSMMAKLIVTGSTRAEAIARARRALAEFRIEGVASVLPFHRAVLAVGSGGTLVELVADPVTLLLPVAEAEVREAMAGLRCAPMLRGWRGREPADVDAAVASILAIADFAVANGERIEELDVNPLGVRAKGRGALALDVLVRTTELPE